MSRLSTTLNGYPPDVLAQSGTRLATQVLTLRNDHTVSFPGTSQFTARGVSACGLAAFNFARIGFRLEQGNGSTADLVSELGTREVVEEIVAICAQWSSDLHLEVEEIHQLPIFKRSLKFAAVEYGRPRTTFFQHILENMNKIKKSAVMIITRPPEIIGCFKFATDVPSRPLFVVFDSHPRPSHPHGAGLSFSTSVYSTAHILSDILPTMEEGVFDSTDLQWQAQLLSNCSAHIYVAKRPHNDHEEAIVQASLSLLTLRAQIAELQHENDGLSSENKVLEAEAEHLRVAVREEQAKAKEKEKENEWSYSLKALSSRVIGRSFGLISHAVAGPSRSSCTTIDRVLPNNNFLDASIGSSLLARPFWFPGTGGAQSIFADNPPPVPSKTPPSYDDLDLESTSSIDSDVWVQTVAIARKLQEEFDSEDRQLRQEQAELTKYVQATFQCGICMDDLPEDDVATIDGCVHLMCRVCLRGFVISKIQERRYPIFCPMCTIAAEAASTPQPSVISRFLIEQLGINEEQSQVLSEMELAGFSVQIHCRECQRPAIVDRDDFSEVTYIVCPQSDCCHMWCKKCDQTVHLDGPKHSCDGTSELNHLIKEQEWKRCPHCTTPIQKEEGCNHMRCISPGCNAHFCYLCGGMIVKSALNNEIGQAVSAHYHKCTLFEVPPE